MPSNYICMGELMNFRSREIAIEKGEEMVNDGSWEQGST